jgi:chromosome partitioning protein
MKSITFAVEKGGTGKTTSAVHLAYALAAMGKNVLLVDTDTQDQCAAHLGVEQYRPGLAELMVGEVTPRQAIVQARPRLFLLPPGNTLAGVKMRLPDIAKKTGKEPQHLLSAALSFTHKGTLDYIVLDAAPGSDAFQVNVLLYADTIIVPVPPEMQAIRGMMRFFKTVSSLGRQVDWILPTFHDRRVSKTFRIMAKLEKRLGNRLLHKISYTSRISEAAGAGLTLFEFDPRHRATGEYQDMARVMTES